MPTTTCATLAHRIRDVFLQGTWIANTNYRHALTFHVDYYLGGVLHCLQGGPLLLSDAQSFQLPPLHTEADWQVLINRLLSHAASFASALEALPDSFLTTPFTNLKYGNWQHNIEGLIEHSYYHLGQVMLLKKWIA